MREVVALSQCIHAIGYQYENWRWILIEYRPSLASQPAEYRIMSVQHRKYISGCNPLSLRVLASRLACIADSFLPSSFFLPCVCGWIRRYALDWILTYKARLERFISIFYHQSSCDTIPRSRSSHVCYSFPPYIIVPTELKREYSVDTLEYIFRQHRSIPI